MALDKGLLLELSRELEEKARRLEELGLDPVPEVNRRKLDEVLSRYKLVLLYFTADWCGPCVSFLNTIREVALDVKHPQLFYARVDVDRSFEVADRYGVTHIPSILVFYEGKVVDSMLGTMSREKLEEKVRSLVKRYLEA